MEDKGVSRDERKTPSFCVEWGNKNQKEEKKTYRVSLSPKASFGYIMGSPRPGTNY